MRKTSYVISTAGVAAVTAIVPFAAIALFWTINWSYGAETTEAIVFNGFFLLYRLVPFVAGALAGQAIGTHEQALSGKRAVLVGALVGGVFCVLILTWSRWAKDLMLQSAAPSIAEVIIALGAGAVASAAVQRLAQGRRRT